MKIIKTLDSTIALTATAGRSGRIEERRGRSSRTDRQGNMRDHPERRRVVARRTYRESQRSWRTTVSTEALLLSPALRRLVALVALFFAIVSTSAYGATYRTDNFIVQAEDAAFAKLVAEQAEEYRVQLANLWLGAPLKRWAEPCKVTVVEGSNVAAAGETVYTFSRGEVFDWNMNVHGTRARILDSVLPHEITHTILASYLRAPAPRWIDEGMATSVEADSERMSYRKMLVSFLYDRRGISFNDMVSMKDYPQDLTPFYSQSFSVCEYLILIGGHKRLVKFAKYGMERRDWNLALKEFYDCESLGALQTEWNGWIQDWTTSNQTAALPPTRKLPEINAPIIPENMIARVGARAPFGVERQGVLNGESVTRGQSGTEAKNGFLTGFPRLFGGRDETPTAQSNGSTLHSGRATSSPHSFRSAAAPNVGISANVLSNGAGTATRVGQSNASPRYYSPISGAHTGR